jgi:hypothetical protein
MSDKEVTKKMGRPVRYDGKKIERTFLLTEDGDEVIEEVAQELKCSRSDALEDLLRRLPRRRKRR